MHLHDSSIRPRNEKLCGQIYIIEKLSKFNVSRIDGAFFFSVTFPRDSHFARVI